MKMLSNKMVDIFVSKDIVIFSNDMDIKRCNTYLFLRRMRRYKNFTNSQGSRGYLRNIVLIDLRIW